MNQAKLIRNALVSVYDKTGLEPVVRKLHALGVNLISTGGTLKFIRDLAIPAKAVEELTSYPEIFGGRVKTLHPAIFGGILNRRNNDRDKNEKNQHAIHDIDLVIVDLYPFEETLASGADEELITEQIDIGGVALIRAAAKNYRDVLAVVSRNDYAELGDLLDKGKGGSRIQDRKYFAAKAFALTSHYDTVIFNYYNREFKLPCFRQSFNKSRVLRYGENPHQKGIYFGNLEALFTKQNGKELSYNNLLDMDAALNLMADFNETSFAILKHNNPCGFSSRSGVLQAFMAALAGDPVSAFGGILICNATIDGTAAGEINKLFFEVIIAPAYEDTALNLLKSKTNRIILQQKNKIQNEFTFRTALNGVIEQERDLKTESEKDLKVVTATAPSKSDTEDLIFAAKLAKHSKSNTIVLVKNRQLLGSGTGQTSRVDALKQAILKAKSFGLDLKGSVMASDAFFPFPDCVQIAREAGITSVIQPGGSVKDNESIAYCDLHGLSMVFTGVRHFRH